jgi:hypothetical protein
MRKRFGSDTATGERHGRALVTTILAAVAGLALAAPATAATLLDTTVSTVGTHARSCFDRDLSEGDGIVTNAATVAEAGLVQARLTGDDGDDWDVAVVESESGRVVAGAAGFASDEVAEGFVLDDTAITVRACRLAGDGDASLQVSSTPTPEQPSNAFAAPKLVNVVTPTPEDEERLQSLGLDLTEHGGEDFLGVVTYGPSDLQRLEEAGFRYTIEVPNLTRQTLSNLEADASYRSSVQASGTPTGRTSYRRLFHYNEEMKRLADRNPDLVKPITLPFETYEGRRVHGIEITEDVDVDDGKPVFLMMGVHHAREWPSGEHAMEWAHELVQGYNGGDDRVVNLLENSRAIVVPIVNPDGFNTSREAGQLLGAGSGRTAAVGDTVVPGSDLAQIAAFPYEYWRKNCRFITGQEDGRCFGQQPSSGIAHAGVDPNRNYGGFWGGPGASDDPTAQDYHGPAPFSEPETQNVRSLVSSRQVTMLITNHTFSNLWLRPPGQAESPETPDEALYADLGEQMASENGYSNIKSFELYDTTGGTEDWTYWTAGGFGFTPEIGCLDKNEQTEDCVVGDFHGPYEDAVVAEYEGTTEEAEEEAMGAESGGNREAYFHAHEASFAPETHSIISGQAPGDATLRIQKTFRTDTWCSHPQRADDPEECEGEDQQPFRDHLESSMEVPNNGQFEWHINPSTRPVAQIATGREATGPPSDPEQFSGAPNPSAVPGGNFDTQNPNNWNDHPFTVPGANNAAIDNAKATVRIDWPTGASDWDMKIFVDSNGDGSSVGETREVGSSAQGAPGSEEEATFVEPALREGRKYVVRVINFAAFEPYQGTITYEGPDPPGSARVESWQLTCERGGEVITSQQLTIARDEQQELDLSACARAQGPDPGPGPGDRGPCDRSRRTIEGTGRSDTLVGTPRRDYILGHGGDDEVRGRGGNDLICGGRGRDHVSGGGGGDEVHGRRGADFLEGNAGADTLRGGPGDDKIRGGRGEDTVTGGRGNDDERD